MKPAIEGEKKPPNRQEQIYERNTPTHTRTNEEAHTHTYTHTHTRPGKGGSPRTEEAKGTGKRRKGKQRKRKRSEDKIPTRESQLVRVYTGFAKRTVPKGVTQEAWSPH